MSLDEAQRRILAVPALLFERNGFRHDRIGGADRPQGAMGAASTLSRWWDVRTTRDAEHCLKWLAEEGHRADWTPRSRVSSMALYAWDFARMASVAGTCYLGYLLDLDTAWQWMKRAALALQPAFGSFREQGEGYMEALALWNGDPDSEEVRKCRAALEALCSREDSPFHLPWNMDLASVPPPVIDQREVQVRPGDSLSAAIEQAGPNGRVIVGAGLYHEALRPPHAIEILAAGDGEVFIQADESPALRVNRNLSVFARGLSLRTGRTSDDQTFNAVHVAGGFVRLEKCEMRASHNGCSVVNDGWAHLIGSRVNDCGRSGLQADKGAVVVVDTEIRAAGLHGVACFGGHFASTIANVRVSGAAGIGLVATGEVLARDVQIEDCGEYGLVAQGELTVIGARISRSKGWGLVVQGGAIVDVTSAVIEHSGKNNVEVAQGRLILRESMIREASGYGLLFQALTRAVVMNCNLANNVLGNVLAMDEAVVAIDDSAMTGGDFGVWSRSTALRCARCSIEDTIGPSVQILEVGGGTFTDCAIRRGQAVGLILDPGGSARLSRCTMEGFQALCVLAPEGTSVVLEDCLLEGEPPVPADKTALTTTVSVNGPDAVEAELPEVVEENGAFEFRVGQHPAIDAAFAARSAKPTFETLGRVLLAQCREVQLDLEALDFYTDDGVMVRSPDKELAVKVREVAVDLLRRPRELRAEVDAHDLYVHIQRVTEAQAEQPSAGTAEA